MVKKNKWIKSMIASMLAVGLLLSPFQTLAVSATLTLNDREQELESNVANQELELTDEQMEALETLTEIRDNFTGLIGFEGDYELPDDSSPVSIIVFFNSSPADVQVIEAQVFGGDIGAATLEEAEANVEAEHEAFVEELDAFFSNPLARFDGSLYEIQWAYRRALNGMAITVPANSVEEIAEFETVAFIMPDETISAPEPIAFEEEHERDPIGMRDARQTMNAHLLHEMGYRGEGVLVAVLDTGIDYYHPAFAGSFPTLEEMYDRNPDNPYLGVWSGMPDFNLGPTNGELPVPAVIPGYDYFFGRNFIRGEGWADWNDPMETSPGHPAGAPGTAEHSNFVNPGRTTSHGTHVAGTIVGRDSGGDNSILGIAPEAYMIAYRVLGPGGSSQLSTVIAGINMIYYDNPDIVNMSLGGGGASPFLANNIAVNNIVLTRPHIVFTNSQGNGGPGFSTLTAPAAASLAIGVSSLTVPGSIGLHAQFPIEDFSRTLGGRTHDISGNTIVTHVHGNADSMWEWADGPNSHIISTFPNFSANDDGEVRLVVLPSAEPRSVADSNSANTGGQTANVGIGTVADFELLFEIYDEEDLEGAWVLISRGLAMVDVSINLYGTGLAGAISITGDGGNNGLIAGNNQQVHFGNAGAWPNFGLLLMVDHLLGLALLDEMPTLVEDANPANSPREMLTFQLTNFYQEDMPLHVTGFSSRGPVLYTFEIKPDIGAQGQGVWSAVPRWTAAQPWEMDGDVPWQGQGNENYYVHAYRPSSGTSMSAPTIAGAAALMVQYSRENHGQQWGAEEIKTRMMNNSILLDYAYIDAGIFDMGAGQVDVYAAVHAEDVVYVTFPKAVNVPQVELEENGFISTRTGSFSFGGSFNSFDLEPDGSRTRTLTATIENQSSTARTYEVSHRFIQTGRLSQDPSHVSLTFSESTITVPAGDAVDFEATMTLAPDAPRGHYEGFVVITQNGIESAVLPFAAVGQGNRILEDVFLGRPVISTNPYHPTGEELNLYFTPHADLAFEMFIVKDEGVDVTDLADDVFEGAIANQTADSVVGYVGTRILPGTGNPSRAVAFHPGMVANSFDEGDYLFVLRVLQQVPFSQNTFVFYETLALPFAIDNTSPEVSEVAVNGEFVTGDEHVFFSSSDVHDLRISGNVFDKGMATAIANDVTFDIWQDSAPYGPEISLENNLAVYVLAGDNAPDNRPVRASVNTDGDFEVLLEGVDVSTSPEVNIWAIDHYTALPNWNMELGQLTDWWSLIDPFPGPNFFTGSNVTAVSAGLTPYLQFAHLPAPGLQVPSNVPLFRQHVWGGLNIERYSFALSLDFVPVVEIEGIPSEWVVDVPLDLDEVATVLPVDATNQDVIWEVVSGDATLADDVFIATTAGEFTLSATIVDSVVDNETNDIIDFVQIFEIVVHEYLYVDVVFEANGGLIAILEEADQEMIDTESDVEDNDDFIDATEETGLIDDMVDDIADQGVDNHPSDEVVDPDVDEGNVTDIYDDADDSDDETDEPDDLVYVENEDATTTNEQFATYFVLPVRLGQQIGDVLPLAIREGYEFLEWNASRYGSSVTIDENTVVLEEMTAYAIWYLSDDATLSNLEVDPGILSPDFDASILNYEVSVDHPTTSILFTATTNHGGARVEITNANGEAIAPATGEPNTFLVPNLLVGENPITITVFAADGSTEVYTVVVKRAVAPVTPPPVVHRVTFNLHGGTGNFPPQHVVDGEVMIEPTATPVRSGYTFAGWFTTATGDVAFDFAIPITAPTTVHAQWEQDETTNNNGGGNGVTAVPTPPRGPRLPQAGSIAFNGTIIGAFLIAGATSVILLKKNKDSKK